MRRNSLFSALRFAARGPAARGKIFSLILLAALKGRSFTQDGPRFAVIPSVRAWAIAAYVSGRSPGRIQSERPWLTFQADYSRWKDGNQKVLKRWETTIESSHGIVLARLGRLHRWSKVLAHQKQLDQFSRHRIALSSFVPSRPSSWLSRKNILASGEFDHQNATR